MGVHVAVYRALDGPDELARGHRDGYARREVVGQLEALLLV